MGLLAVGSPVTLGPTLASAATNCASVPNDDNCTGMWPGSGCMQSDRIVGYTNYTDPRTGWRFEINLMYSNVCYTNWTWIRAYSPTPQTDSRIFRAKVRRLSTTLSGADAPEDYKLEYSDSKHVNSWQTIAFVDISSRMVYARYNAAQGCVGISRDPDHEDFSGSADNVKCTAPA